MTSSSTSRPVRILPEHLANLIAAGEVVERPASVLKELVENSLDAGAARITVEVAAAGRRLIRVVDDGAGMSPDDLLSSLERHATSKITSAEDLAAVASLGFRGEALPSIAAVSKMILRSRISGQEAGSQLRVAGGSLREVSEVGCPIGTIIEVRDLFYNTPARRKFLKSRATEAGHLGAAFLRMALARPDVTFRYRSDGKVLYDLPATTDLRVRVSALLGREAAAQMISLDQQHGPLRVRGLIGLPSLTRSAPDQVFTFINGRFVRDRVLLHAVYQGYRGLMPDNRRPVMALHIELDPATVDVNVHPAKVEVRFHQQKEVHDSLVQCLRRGLAAARGAAGEDHRQATDQPPAHGRTYTPTGPSPHAAAGYTPPPGPPLATQRSGPAVAAAPAAGMSPGPPTEEPRFSSETARPRALYTPTGELSYIGQLHGLYLLCSSPQGLVVVDQHAAHERLAYEELRRAMADGALPSQGLLAPRVLELTPREAAWAQRQAPVWQRLGLELASFGPTSWAVSAVPPFMAGTDPGPKVKDMLAEMAGAGVNIDTPEFLEQAMRSLACRGAIKKGQHISPEEARGLLAKLSKLDGPVTCPHGRPVFLTVDRSQLARAFKRSGP